MTNENVESVCSTPGCGGKASMRCPKCIQAGLTEDGFFCSQVCFSGYWKDHKAVHARKALYVQLEGQSESNEINYPGFQFTGSLRPYKQTPKRIVPDNIEKPDYADTGVPESERAVRSSNSIIVLSNEEQGKMRKVCELAREVLDEAVKVAKVGITTDYIDKVVHEACISRQCYPSPLNYYNFPKSCCTSINEVICHGIPDLRPLQDGDILNIDITVYHDGFHGDLNETIFIGNVSDENKKLVRVSYECLEKAMEMVKPGTRYRDLGDAITKHASTNNLSVVRTYCGHGIHRLFHCSPNVPHYSKNKAIGIMKPGHVFTIEPMINAGVWRDSTWPDQWTAVTVDGKRSAQFEQTFLVTETGCEILTGRHSHKGKPYFMDQEVDEKSRKVDSKNQKIGGDIV